MNVFDATYFRAMEKDMLAGQALWLKLEHGCLAVMAICAAALLGIGWPF